MALGTESIRLDLPLEAGWRALEDTRLPPEQAGAVRTLREAEDDARTIACFLRRGMASRDLDPEQVLWVIDLAPGDGERAWRVLRQLASAAPRSPPLRYLARCLSRAHYECLAKHPYLKPLIARGSLFLDRDGSGVPSHPVRNPIVVLAHGGFSSQSQALYAAHHGELLEAGSDGLAGLVWRTIERRDGLWPLLSTYRQSLSSAVFTVPHEAMATLARLLRVSGGRLLLRACDSGVKDLAQIRMGALARMPGQPLPVNFEALARWHRASGGSVQQLQRDDSGRVLHLALHDTPNGRLRACLPDLLALPHPDDHEQVLRAVDGASELSLTQCLATLLAQGGDARALVALAERISEQAPVVSGSALRQWREMLAQCWIQYFPSGVAESEERVRSLIGSLAMVFQNWPLARTVLRAQLRAAPRDPGCWQRLAQCQMRTGGARAAALSLTQAHALDDRSPTLKQAMATLDARRVDWSERPAYREALARDGQLVLEPLDTAHAADLLHQYRDPEIGMAARLPAFADLAALHEWIAQRAANRQRADYAVMHADRGFVGAVGAHWQGESALMHFWMGADHQGKGLGVRAVRLLLRLLAAHGIRYVFCAVYADNYRSLRTLRRLGFVDMPLHALAPEASVEFLAWAAPPEMSVATLCDGLLAFSCVTGSGFRFSDDDATLGPCRTGDNDVN